MIPKSGNIYKAKHLFQYHEKRNLELVATRYPDVADEIPAKLYTEGLAKEFLEKTREIITWLQSQMPKQ